MKWSDELFLVAALILINKQWIENNAITGENMIPHMCTLVYEIHKAMVPEQWYWENKYLNSIRYENNHWSVTIQQKGSF